MLTDAQFFDIDASTFIALDTETTGLQAHSNRIIEIAAIRYQNGVEVDRFEQLIHPGRGIPEEITRLTGISDDDVIDAPTFRDCMTEFLHFLGNSPIVGYNVNFDIGFLESEFKRCDPHKEFTDPLSSKWLRSDAWDAMILTRMLFPYLDGYNLGTVANHFQIPLDRAHRAAEDAKATGELFLIVLDELCHRELEPLALAVELTTAVKHSMASLFQGVLKAKQKGVFETDRLLLNQMNLPSNIIGKAVISEDGQSRRAIDAERIIEDFSDDGPLSKRITDYESRPEQMDLARDVIDALNESKLLVAEAGTGTGKSLAYLLPSIRYAIENRSADGRVLVSTNTKNLQDQLFYKDLPTIQPLVPDDFMAVLLKGKGNYLCLDKWKRTLVDERIQLSDRDVDKILPLLYWAAATQTGDIAENNAFNVERNTGIWSRFIAENNYCYGRKCPHFSECYLMQVRNASRQADLVVVNHSLVFSNLNNDNSLIGPFKHVVLDEAHNIERVATDYLGGEFTFYQCQRIARHLRHQRGKQLSGILPKLHRQLGLVQFELEDSIYEGMQVRVEALDDAVDTFQKVYPLFFDELSHFLRGKQRDASEKIRFHDGASFFRPIQTHIDQMLDAIDSLAGPLQDLTEMLNEMPESVYDSMIQVLQDLRSRAQDMIQINVAFTMLINGGLENYVFWAEAHTRNDRNDASLKCAPLDVGQLLHPLFFDQLESAVLCSATMTVNQDFQYVRNRIGLDRVDHTRQLETRVGSPFEYDRQMKLSVTRFLPDPGHRNFNLELARFIARVARLRQNGILVLFTSYATMDQIHRLLEAEQLPRRILVQGRHGSRSALTHMMRTDPSGMLLGTDSFWEGVDLAGKSVETLIITKLPFAVPSEPVIAAKMDAIRQQAGNPFMDFSLPEAVIKFRQGFGRLIRTKSDVGEVIVTDHRVVTKRYGRSFLNSLPTEANLYSTESEYFDA